MLTPPPWKRFSASSGDQRVRHLASDTDEHLGGFPVALGEGTETFRAAQTAERSRRDLSTEQNKPGIRSAKWIQSEAKGREIADVVDI